MLSRNTRRNIYRAMLKRIIIIINTRQTAYADEPRGAINTPKTEELNRIYGDGVKAGRGPGRANFFGTTFNLEFFFNNPFLSDN